MFPAVISYQAGRVDKYKKFSQTKKNADKEKVRRRLCCFVSPSLLAVTDRIVLPMPV